MIPEKAECCPSCGAELTQQEYDFQFHLGCRWNILGGQNVYVPPPVQAAADNTGASAAHETRPARSREQLAAIAAKAVFGFARIPECTVMMHAIDALVAAGELKVREA